MLDELKETGYVGTELGDWGFMPTDPVALHAELARRDLAMIGAFVGVALKHPECHAPGEAEALKHARLLAAVAETGPGAQPPFIIISDNNGTDAGRTAAAGRVTPELGLTDDDWKTFAAGAERIARAVRAETGLRTLFHHHCAGNVETPAEIERLLAMTDPALLGLVFDTGHYLYGSGATDAAAVLEGLERFRNRIWHIHYKDCQPEVATRARREGWNYFTALQHGVFCELGRGSVDFPRVTAWLQGHGFAGWIVVEQDVLPGMGAPRESARRNREYLRSIGL
jgi:inosose dehydratase